MRHKKIAFLQLSSQRPIRRITIVFVAFLGFSTPEAAPSGNFSQQALGAIAQLLGRGPTKSKGYQDSTDPSIPSLQSAQAKINATTKFPPYPDVWGYEMAFDRIDVFRMPDGDFLIHAIEMKTREQIRYQDLFFFSGKRWSFSREEFGEFWKANQQRHRRQSKITLSDGSSIAVVQCSGRCCPVVWEYLQKNDKTGKPVWRKAVLYLLDQPEERSFSPVCDENSGLNIDSVSTRVGQRGSSLVPLEDETFLIVTRNIVLRVNGNFETRSDLLMKRVFIVPMEKIEEIVGRKNDVEAAKAIEAHLLELKKG